MFLVISYCSDFYYGKHNFTLKLGHFASAKSCKWCHSCPFNYSHRYVHRFPCGTQNQ